MARLHQDPTRHETVRQSIGALGGQPLVTPPGQKHPMRRFGLASALGRVDRRFDAIATTISNPNWITFDGYAIWFYAICATIFLVFCLAGLQGSSISIYSSLYHYGEYGAKPLLGVPRSVRVDEWNFHTPAILNQYLRTNRFSPDDTLAGPGKAGLIANIPVRHFTTVFRPEFWGFFVLPFDYAYSVYWEAKWFILLTGLFTLLLLLTQSTPASVIGALWFLFSSSTQWQLSWPSLLPDMAGLCCWIICFVCYLLVTTNLTAAAIAALCTVGCAVDFAMCAYIPHQIPFVWFAVFVVFFWASLKLPLIMGRPFRRKRMAVLLLTCLALMAIMGLLYRDIAPTVAKIGGTSYPGQRSMGGGSNNLIALGSDFLDLWKTETHFPLVLGNICEGAGFLWLAPVVLFSLTRVRRLDQRQKGAFFSLGLLFVLMWSWQVLPVPAKFARFTFFDRVGCGRAIPALGLANVAVVTLALSWSRSESRRSVRQHLIESSGIFAITLIVLGLVNFGLGNFFSLIRLYIAAVLLTAAIKCMLEGWMMAFGCAVVLPSMLAVSLANPVQRGFDTVFGSEIFQTVQSRPELQRGKWLVFSQDPTAVGFFGSLGCDVYNGLKYAPDLKGLALFDPTGKDHAIFNQSGYLLADVPNSGLSEGFEGHGVGIVLWKVSPLDRRLRRLGIRYAAFLSQPPSAVLHRLKPLASNPVGRFWLYELP